MVASTAGQQENGGVRRQGRAAGGNGRSGVEQGKATGYIRGGSIPSAESIPG